MAKPNEALLQLQSPETPLTFRQELVPHIFRAIRGGRSCALVGVKGAGMSNLLRFVCEPRVAASQMSDSLSRTLLVYLEGDLLLDATGLYQAMIRGILEGARRFDWPKAELAALRHLAGRLLANREAPEAEEVLTEIIAYLGENRQCRVVVVFDEFDSAFVELPAASLRGLRRLRDNHKAWLSYLIGTCIELTCLVERRGTDGADVSKFTELFNLHTFSMKPYTHLDALDLIARKIFEQDQQPNAEQQDRLYRATGGHAKLLVAGLTALVDRRHLPWPDIERDLRESAVLAEHCHEIWNDLDEGEQVALGALAADRPAEVQADDLTLLRLKGMVVGRPDRIFASLFEAYVNRRFEETTPPQSPPASSDDPNVSAEPRPPGRPRRRASKLRDPEARIDW